MGKVKGKRRNFRKESRGFNKKKKNTIKKPKEEGNRKHHFNRYKDKKVVEAKLAEKKKMEEKMEAEMESSESEEETDPMQQLLSTFDPEQMDSGSENEDSEDDNDLDDAESEQDEAAIQEEEVGGIEAAKINPTDAQSDGYSEDVEIADECEIDIETEKEDTSSATNDNFTKHYKDELHESLLKSVSSVPQVLSTSSLNWPLLGNIISQIPVSCQDMENGKNKPAITVLEEKVFTQPGKIPNKLTSISWDSLYVKKQIQNNIAAANSVNLCRKECELSENLTSLQKEIFSIVNNYQDFYYSQRSFINAEEIRFVYTLHALNHILKTRTKILHHNARLVDKDIVSDEFRDQGLVRPKVLIIAPFKDSAYRIVKMLIALLVPEDTTKVINKNRFEEDFTGNELAMPKKNPKPEDYELTFIGNTDDTFRLGISVTKKSLKLYADFYSSDIIIASPLGLRVIVGAEGEEGRDFDFLASIEMLIIDQCDIIFMQNWDHLLHILDHLHLQPKKPHGTDFSRLRLWAVNGWTKYYRQTLMFSSVALPEINSLLNKRCFNYAGKFRVHNPIEVGTIRQVAVPIPQVFRRIEVKDPISALDSRFDCFISEILSQYKDNIMAHTMIYVPSYFDYVRIRNHFKKEETSFVQICEYSKDAKIARARDMFFHTEAHFLLYSERFHFFRRMRIKGIRHIIFYQPPTFSHFYSEICNLMQEANQNKYGGSESNMTVTVLYTKYDLQQISAIVGSERTAKMVQSDKNTCMFMTGD